MGMAKSKVPVPKQSELSLKAQDAVMIIKTCKEAGVLTFELDNLKIVFGKVEEPAIVPDHQPHQSQFNRQMEIPDTGYRLQEETYSEDDIENMMISDPVKYEELMTKDEDPVAPQN